MEAKITLGIKQFPPNYSPGIKEEKIDQAPV